MFKKQLAKMVGLTRLIVFVSVCICVHLTKGKSTED